VTSLRLQISTDEERALDLQGPEGRVLRYEFDANRAQIVLGRRGGVDVLLPESSVALEHARILRQAGGYFLVDEGSAEGTRLNGVAVPVGGKTALRNGDRVGIGEFVVEIQIETGVDWPAESSSSGSMARHMAEEVLERLGPGDSQPSLEVLDGPEVGVLLVLSELGRTYVLGCTGRGELRLDDVDLWRERAALVRDAEGVTIRELGSVPPPLVNGARLEGARVLQDGDVVSLAGVSLLFRDPAEMYLRRLEASVPEPEAPADHDTRSTGSRAVVTERPPSTKAPRSGLDAGLWWLAIVVAALAMGGLVWVLS